MTIPIHNKQQYMEAFSGPPSDRAIRAEALKNALDIRKFEIEMYWKRAGYFWTLIVASFTGYFLLQTKASNSYFSIFIITCIGFLLSLGWYLVNRGSKFWQENWERHVDVLEDEITGPLYKTTISKELFPFWKLAGGYPYSVSKINQIVSLFVTVIWIFLNLKSYPPDTGITYALAVFITISFALFLVFGVSTGPENKPRIIRFSKTALSDFEAYTAKITEVGMGNTKTSHAEEKNEMIRTAVIAAVAALIGSILTLGGVFYQQHVDQMKFQIQRRDTYQLAALEQRLKVYQETYALARRCQQDWRIIKKRPEYYKRFNDILVNKSIYLDDKSRLQLALVVTKLSQSFSGPGRLNLEINGFEGDLMTLRDNLLNGANLSPDPRSSNVRG